MMELPVMNEDGTIKHDREALVTELLWFMYQHQCCGSHEMYTELYAEARASGWKLPEGM
jgi:hypothetical protein